MYVLCRSLRLTVGAFNIHCARLLKYSGRKANSSKHRKQSIIQQCYPNPQTISRPGLSFLTDHIVNRRSGSAVPCRSDENVYLQQVYVRLSTGQVDQLEDRYIGIVEVASSNLALSTHPYHFIDHFSFQQIIAQQCPTNTNTKCKYILTWTGRGRWRSLA